MPIRENPSEALGLRRLVRDVVALSTLPAIWTSYGPEAIIGSLADVLMSTLLLDLLYIRLQGHAGEPDIEVARCRHRSDAGDRVRGIAEAVAPCLKVDNGPMPTLTDPLSGTALQMAVVRFGHTGDVGVMVVGSQRGDFPTEAERLLLGLGANQTFIVIQRKRMERALADQREWFRVTLASIGDAVITTDTEGRVASMNAVAESLTGWTQEDALGKPLAAVFDIINERTRKPVENPVERVLAEGKVVGLANHTSLIAKDGAERSIDDSAAPIRSAEGRIVGCVLVFRDVTERRRQDERKDEQREAARRLAAIVDSSEDAIISKTLDGIIQTWNAAAERVFGYTPDEAVGRSITMLFPADRLDEEDKIIARIRAGERVEHFNTVRQRKDGTVFSVSLTISPIKDGEGRIIGASKIARDITEQKRAEELFRDEDRRKTEFLATLAHELRNPLAPVRNGLQVMKLAKNDAEQVEQARSMMERQLRQMVRLIDDLMDLSRINRGNIELRKERVELAKIVQQAIETSRPMIEAGDHDLTIRAPSQPIYVDGDAARLAQVFSNLLNNAAKYTDRGGQITLAVQRNGAEVVVSVRDTGVGIPAPMLPKVFEMFTQVDRSLERSQGGLGIGLSLVKRLVEMHGGSVEAHSPGLGMGSELVVRLPAALAVARGQRDDEQEAAVAARRRILVVDDNRDGAVSLAMMLNLMGNEARTAHDGLEAVDVASVFRPDVVLLDIGMPKLNGYDAARRIREQPWGKNMALVAVTGWGLEDDKRRSQEAGFNLHIVKPVDPAALETLLASLRTETA